MKACSAIEFIAFISKPLKVGQFQIPSVQAVGVVGHAAPPFWPT